MSDSAPTAPQQAVIAADAYARALAADGATARVAELRNAMKAEISRLAATEPTYLLGRPSTGVIDIAVVPLLEGEVVRVRLKTVNGWAEFHLIQTDARALGDILVETVKRARGDLR